jgi:His/Glu/Gln/Arg/opine family amino acid ABC transporter permease subunit
MVEILWRNLPYLLRGTEISILLFLGSLVVGTVVGVGSGLMSVSRNRVWRGMVVVYIYVVRGIPLLVHLFVMYYVLPALAINIDPYAGGVLVLAIYMGAFISEITRGAVGSVSRGQLDAAQSLGMTRGQAMRKIVLPQAVRYFIPPYINSAVMLVKLTSVVSIISVWELTLSGREVVERTLAPFQIFGGIALIYFVICYSLSLFGRSMERRVRFTH